MAGLVLPLNRLVASPPEQLIKSHRYASLAWLERAMRSVSFTLSVGKLTESIDEQLTRPIGFRDYEVKLYLYVCAINLF